MGSGSFIASVRNTKTGGPIIGAKVTIKSESGAIINELVTDESGNTQIQTLDAPTIPIDVTAINSLKVQANYDVSITDTGYVNINYSGVQIFDGEKTILNVNVTPHMTRDIKFKEIVIPARFGFSVKKNQLEPTNKASEAPIIPEFVTIHLNNPDVQSENVTVPFLDYIKNVASSETYPFWPVISLEANILAQITFVINRITTSFYRKMGCDFDITSSAIHDQYYVHEKNIFESVSLICDEIFDNYVRIKGTKPPFFTRYCNGITTTCDGLNQAGSIGLALNNYDTLGILKYYYPYNIEIGRAKTKATENYELLTEGSFGTPVIEAQALLEKISNLYPKIKKRETKDGIFDRDMAEAVKTFQEIFQKAQTGTINKATWQKLYETANPRQTSTL